MRYKGLLAASADLLHPAIVHKQIAIYLSLIDLKEASGWCREAEERALQELKAAKEELNNLKEREAQLTSAYKDARDRVESLRNSNTGKE